MATRLERVIVDLDDRFSRPAARMAVVTRRLSERLDESNVSARGAGDSVDYLGLQSRRSGPDIDRYSGRLRLLAQVGASLGPALIPVGAVGIPAVTGLAAQMGFAAVAGGTMLAAFNGVGEALKAVNKAGLEPTEANIEAARLAMEQISPQARELVAELRELGPILRGIRDEAGAEMFPGLIDGLNELERLGPVVERIVGAVGGELGDIAADSGASLAGERWRDFFEFLETDAPPAIRDLTEIVGNLTHGAAEMWMAFDPVNDDFSKWLVNTSADFDEWAGKLSQTEGFEDFVDYLRENGPQVEDTLAAVATALVDILEAASPLGGPALQAIEGIAKAVSAVADSEMGTPIFAAIAAVSTLNLLLKTTQGLARVATGSLGATMFAGAGATAGGGRGRGAGAAVAAPVIAGSGKQGGGKHRAGKRPAAAAGGGAGLESVAWVVGASAGLDYLDRKLGEVGGRGKETQKILRDFDLPKEDVFNKFLFGDSKNTIAADLDRVLDAKRFGGFFSGIEADLGRALGGTTFTRSLENVTALDRRLYELAQRDPGKAMDTLATITRRTGASTEELNRALPKSTAALRGQAKAAGDVGSLLRQGIPQLARYDRILRGFPKAAITEIATKGLPQTRRSIVDLTEKYNLTPKQVATLIRQKGGDPTKRMVRGIIDDAKALDRQKPNPRLSAKDDATRTIRKVGTELRTLDGDSATVSIFTKRVTTTVQEFFTRKNSAMGNLFPAVAFAQGGFGDAANNHQPELYRGATTRVWGEPETGGEAYIPLKNDHRRPRAQEIAAETVDLLGGVAYFADGGRTGPTRASGRGRGERRSMAAWREELEKSRKALARERAQRESLIDRRDTLRGTVRDSFRSDLFAPPSNVWAAGAGDPLSILRADIANARAFKTQMGKLRKAGVSGDALASIAATGDLSQATALASRSKADLRAFQSLFNQRASVTAAVGRDVSGAAYAAAIAISTSELRQIKKILARQEKVVARQEKVVRAYAGSGRKRAKDTGREVAKGVNSGAQAAKRKRRSGR